MKILLLQKRILFPADVGGKIRTLNVVRYLARWHDVTYLCNIQETDAPFIDEMRDLGVTLETIPWDETPRETLGFYRDLAINLCSRYPFNVDKDYDPRLRKRAAELLRDESFDLLICDFVQMARNAIGLDAPATLLFEHNVEAQIFQRHAQFDPGWLRRKFMAYQWRKMHRFEGEAGRHFDTVVAVSQKDRETFESEYGWQHTEVIDTAVDIEFFTPDESAEKPDRVVFVGSMDWVPNQDGIQHFVKHIWPLIRRERPQAHFQVVGRNPSSAVQQLNSEPGVEIVGTVPDIRPYLAEASVVVVPLLVGGGTRLKIFEAMSMQKAVVSTQLGAEGLNLQSGDDVILADAPDDFAKSVVQLLNDSKRRNSIAENARRLVVENYSAECIARQFETICQETVERAASRAQPHSSAHAAGG